MAAQQLAVERRALLKFLLQDAAARGREVLLPVGCSDYDEWLLDALSVDRLLKQLRQGGGGKLDLINATITSSTGPLAASVPGGRRDSWQTPRSARSSGRDDVPVLDFRALGLGSPASGAGDGAGDSLQAEAQPGGEEDAGLPQLKLRSLRVGLREHQLKELAYAVFLSTCGPTASPGLLADLRASLELPEARATELRRITELAGQHGVRSLASLESHAKLLQVVRPTAFDTFRNFVRWRDTVASTVWLVLSQAARDAWAPAGDASARTLLARLKGGLRRLDCRSADEYDESEYAAAADAAFAAAEQLAAHCSTGWAFPWGLRARLAELLLRGIFDTLDEGQYSEHRQELLGLLQGDVWKQLEVTADVHNAVFAWVHFRQFAVSQELLLLEVARQAIQQVTAAAGAAPPAGPDGAALPLLVTKEAQDAAFPAEVMACISGAVCDLLSSYHATVDDPRVMKGLVGVLDAAEAACGRREGLPDVLGGCIAASVEAAFADSLAELSANVTAEEDLIMLLAASSAELLKREGQLYTPLLLPAQPAARAIAAAMLHESFGAKMLPWLIGVNGLTKSALEAIRASMALEELLLEEGRDDPPPLWGTMERLSPLLYTWAQGQITMLGGWMDRILAGEDWSRVSKQRAHGSRSVVETIKIVTETLEALFDMRLAIPAGVVRCLTEGVDLALQKYCDFVRAQVGAPDALIPGRPPLTRYKRELVVAAEEAAAAAGYGGGGGGKGKKGDVPGIAWLPPLGATEEELRVMALSYDSLVVRLNSVQHLMDSLGGLERMVIERWDDGRPQSAKAREGSRAYDWIAGLFDGARKAAARSRDHLARFIAVKVVYGDLRTAIFEQLYRFHVSVSRLETVLQETDAQLGELCGHVHDALPPKLARAVCAQLVAAVQFVLLDGGPYRLFTPQDCDLLEGDMAQMRAMFYADGDGMSLEEVDALCRPLSDVVDAMGLETGLVIQNLKQAQSSGGGGRSGRTPSPRGGSGPPAAMDPDVLLRILCHRADHAASKLLKKDYKIAKKLPTGLADKAGGLLRFSSRSER